MKARRERIDRKDLHRAVDGELSRRETTRLRKALKRDPGTRAELRSLKDVATTPKKVLPKVKAVGLKDRVIAGIRRKGG